MRNIDKVIPVNNLVYSNKEACVYKLIHKDTGKVYIGSTEDIYHRCEGHANSLLSGSHYNKNIQDVFNLSPTFELEIIPVIVGREERIKLEQKLINEQNIKGNMLNIALDADVSARGRTLSDEHKAAILSSTLGRKQSQETKEKISIANTGLVRSEETRAKMSEIAKARVLSDETKARISEHSANRKPVIVKNTEYKSICEASNSIKVSPNAIKRRIASTKEKYSDYKYK